MWIIGVLFIIINLFASADTFLGSHAITNIIMTVVFLILFYCAKNRDYISTKCSRFSKVCFGVWFLYIFYVEAVVYRVEKEFWFRYFIIGFLCAALIWFVFFIGLVSANNKGINERVKREKEKENELEAFIENEKKSVQYKPPIHLLKVTDAKSKRTLEAKGVLSEKRYIYFKGEKTYINVIEEKEYLNSCTDVEKAFWKEKTWEFTLEYFDTPVGIYPMPQLITFSKKEHDDAFNAFMNWRSNHMAIIDKARKNYPRNSIGAWSLAYFSAFYPKYASILRVDYEISLIDYKKKNVESSIETHFEVERRDAYEYIEMRPSARAAHLEYDNIPSHKMIVKTSFNKLEEEDNIYSDLDVEARVEEVESRGIEISEYAYNDGYEIHFYEKVNVSVDFSNDDYLESLEKQLQEHNSEYVFFNKHFGMSSTLLFPL